MFYWLDGYKREFKVFTDYILGQRENNRDTWWKPWNHNLYSRDIQYNFVGCVYICVFDKSCTAYRKCNAVIVSKIFSSPSYPWPAEDEQSFHYSLPESEALPSVGLFAECLLSGTRQRRLCREPHSVKLGSRQQASLPSAGHSAQDPTRQRETLGKGGARQKAVSGRPKADDRQSLPRAEGWHSAKDSLPSVFSRHSTKYIFIFLILSPKLFVVCSYTM
jgi:hypothetical protein